MQGANAPSSTKTAQSASLIRRVALVVHPSRPIARELATIVDKWWAQHGVEVVMEDAEGGPRLERFASDIDVAISLGGDGTMLRTVALAAPVGIPVLGVNLGNLGYLTTVEPEEITTACERLMAGHFVIEDRMMIDVLIRRATDQQVEPRKMSAMNEVVVEKTSDGHTIYLAVRIGEDQFLTYAADGMLVATPTGSTAYNLSLRGPIVSPRIEALIMTPIAPHMLFDRTLIIEPELQICFELLPDREAVAIVDGERIAELSPGDRIEVSASSHHARMIKVGDHGFYHILHTKFGLLDR